MKNRKITITTNEHCGDHATLSESLKELGKMIEEGFKWGLNTPVGLDWQLEEISEED